MTSAPVVSVVIPVFNNWEMTRDCLESLARHAGIVPFEVILADNGSTDATATDAASLGRSLFGGSFHLLRQERNLGFAGAINAGAAHASGDFLYLLNNDTLLPDEPFSPLLDALGEDPSLGAAGPLLLYPGGERVQHLGIAVSHGVKSVHLYHLFPAVHRVVARKRRLQAITMAAFCVPRALFDKLGGLHEGFVNGMEDIDFCVRMGREGLGCSVVPQTTVLHLTSQTAGRFDHDGPNSRLLASRCGQSLAPDLNLLAGEDGFELHFTPWLDPYLVPGPDLAKELDAALADDFSVDRAAELVEREPCWERGWNQLAGHCRETGDVSGELAALVRKSAFIPTPETFAAMRDAASRAGDHARLAALDGQDERIRAVVSRPASLRSQARGSIRRAEDTNNPGLAAILSDWLDENFPEQGGAS